MMKNSRKIGKEYEKKACEFLKNKGYEILSENYTIKGGEIDIVAKSENTIIFIEVKYRKNCIYGDGLEAIDRKKARRLFLTAEDFLQKNSYEDYDIRFDSITFFKEEITWTKNLIWGDEIGF